MSDQQPTTIHQLPVAYHPPARLLIPAEIAASLPPALRDELALLPAAKQAAFVDAFRNRSANLLMTYLCSLVYCHYGLLGRWAMTGWMWLSLFVASTIGTVWWLLDLVRIPGMVREHNERVATEILRALTAPTDPAPLAGA